MDTAARTSPLHHHFVALVVAAITGFALAACSGGAAQERAADTSPTRVETSEISVVTPDIETAGVTTENQPPAREAIDYPDEELASIAVSLMTQAEVTNPDWEQHLRERFTGPGLDAWIEGRHEALAEIGLTVAQRAAAEAVRGEVTERGQDVGIGPDLAKVSVWMKQPLLDGLARFDLRMVFEDQSWKIRVPSSGLSPQGRTG